MKKKLAVLLIASMVIGMLAGCGSQKYDDSSQNLSDINIEKYVTKLGEYKGLEISGTKEVITDEYVDSYIDYMLTNSQEPVAVSDRAVQSGDVVNIDYVGTKDGVEFDGGSYQGYDLTIGSGSFISGFEDGLIGKNAGDVVELNLTFPEDYSNADLAGQAVVFKVTINSISEMQIPELNDEYVKSLAIENCENVAQFKVVVKDSLESNAESTYQSDLQTKAMNALMEKCEFAENPPEGIVAYYTEMISENFKNEASSKNMSLTDFISQYYGMSEEQYNEQIATGAKNSANQAMVCMLVAQKEGLLITDDELDTAIEANYKNFGYESVEDYKAKANVEDYRDYLVTKKVLEFLVENAVITEETETEAVTAESLDFEPTTEETSEAASETTSETTSETETAE